MTIKKGFISPPPKLSLVKRVTQDTITCENITRNIIKPYILYLLRKKEYKKSYGTENSDKTFYIIGFPRGEDGLLFIILCNLSHISYALGKGYIPVVDLQNFDNQYLEHGEQSTSNSWEYYFEQPLGFTLDTIKNSKNIVLSNKLQMPNLDYKIDFYIFGTPERLLYFRKIFQEYIKFNKTTIDFVSNEYNHIMSGKKKVLGVLCRGTDYLLKEPVGHPRQPEPIEVVNMAKKVLAEKNCDHLYLATEDDEIYNLFKQNFGNRLLTNSQKRYSANELKDLQYISQIRNRRKMDKYLSGLEYLSSLNILSKCSCFIGGRTAGTIGVYLMTDGFEYDYTWDRGFYPQKSNAFFNKLTKSIFLHEKNK
jgi:hypothetical protein